MNEGQNARSLSAVAILLAALLLGAALCLPPQRLAEPWGVGHVGGSNAVMTNWSRSYHLAPAAFSSLIPSYYRDARGDTRQVDLYTSQFPTVHLGYAAWTRLFGVSETSIRLAAAFCTLCVLLATVGMLWQKSPTAAAAAAFLFITSPLALKYGAMAETAIVWGAALALAVWGYGRFVGKTLAHCGFFLAALPLVVSGACLPPLFAAAVFFVHVALLRRGWRESVRLIGAVIVPWAALCALHVACVAAAYGDISCLFVRASARGLLAAFATIDNPLLNLSRHVFERLAAPLSLLTVLAAFAAWRHRRADPERFAMTTTAATTAALFLTALLQWAAAHGFSFQVFLPTVCLMGGPMLAELWQGLPEAGARRNGTRRWLAAVIIAVCAGMFVHQYARKRGPSEYERDLARLSGEAGAAARGGKVLFVSRKGLFGAQMSVQYYGDATLDCYRARLSEDANMDYSLAKKYAAILGSDCGQLEPGLRQAAGASEAEVRRGAGGRLFLIVNHRPEEE